MKPIYSHGLHVLLFGLLMVDFTVSQLPLFSFLFSAFLVKFIFLSKSSLQIIVEKGDSASSGFSMVWHVKMLQRYSLRWKPFLNFNSFVIFFYGSLYVLKELKTIVSNNYPFTHKVAISIMLICFK